MSFNKRLEHDHLDTINLKEVRHQVVAARGVLGTCGNQLALDHPNILRARYFCKRTIERLDRLLDELDKTLGLRK